MTDRAWGAEYRTTIVCIDSYVNGIPVGRFYNPYQADGRTFQSTSQFLLEMELALDAMDFPKSFTATRNFAPPPRNAAGPPVPLPHRGHLATFAVKVLFRQNASWQGTVTWQEGLQEQSFRSVLELLLLMDSALQEQAS